MPDNSLCSDNRDQLIVRLKSLQQCYQAEECIMRRRAIAKFW